ncbi:MAG: DUF222 domain-containing protein [Acidimicrobiales bacterium]
MDAITSSGHPLDAAALAQMSNEAIMDLAAETSRQMASLAGHILLLTGELDRRDGWRDEGATSVEAWLVERCGVSVATARAWAHVAQRLFDLPRLAAALCEGEISFDKVRAVVDAGTPETDPDLCEQARASSVRELAQLDRSRSCGTHNERRTRSLRFNDDAHTLTAQLPPESFAEVRAHLESRAKRIPSDGSTPWDERLCDAFVSLVRSHARGGATSPFFVVAHAPLDALLDEALDPSELAAELEHGGRISVETLRRVACDATIAIAVDDDVGHTMYEGRATRDPTDAQRRELRRRDRDCRFPGCTNATFTNPHHIRPWKPDGPTDLDNLCLLCEYHHHLVHGRQWTLSGNANEVLTAVGPTSRVMTSRPSPLWTGRAPLA